MGLRLIQVHQTEKGFISQGVAQYVKRLNRFTKLDITTIELPKKLLQLPADQLKEKEAEKILESIQPNDFLVLLDEKGKQFTSNDFAHFMDEKLAIGGGNLVFIIGGAYGFHHTVYNQANSKLSLSKMTTTHQLVRVLFLEQLYRAFTILTNHPYHNN